jgi:hypothetical protein
VAASTAGACARADDVAPHGDEEHEDDDARETTSHESIIRSLQWPSRSTSSSIRRAAVAAGGGLSRLGRGGRGVSEKILSRDPATGDVTRLLRFEAGVETAETIAHDFWEEVWILEGEVIDVGKARRSRPGCTRAARPACCTARIAFRARA